jgi:hypothetical protein
MLAEIKETRFWPVLAGDFADFDWLFFAQNQASKGFSRQWPFQPDILGSFGGPLENKQKIRSPHF